jgi:translation initiation factor IF-2
VEMLTPEVLRANLGRVKILAVFRTEKDKMIVGGSVIEGKIKNNSMVEINRGDAIVGKGQILELQQNKIKSEEVTAGSEFGISVKSDTKILEGDILQVYEESVRKKSL